MTAMNATASRRQTRKRNVDLELAEIREFVVAAMVDPTIIDRFGVTSDEILPGPFATVFDAIVALNQREEDVTVCNLANELDKRGELAGLMIDCLMGREAIDSVLGQFSYVPDQSSNAARIKDRARRRRMSLKADAIQVAANDPTIATSEMAALADDLAAMAHREVPAGFRPKGIADLIRDHPTPRTPIIGGVLRRGEVANLIASPKTAKSWMAMGLAVSVASGTLWLDTFPCTLSRVLVLDSELHPETFSDRFRTVCTALGVAPELLNDRIDVDTMRGSQRSLPELTAYLKGIEPRTYGLIIVDALYRFLPEGIDENSNTHMTRMFTILDTLAQTLDCAILTVHHTTKGNQNGKLITDVGAGAGAQSRAADAHLVLKAHAEPGIATLAGVVRSFSSFEPICLSFDFPCWKLRSDLDSSQPKSTRSADRRKVESESLAERVYEKMVSDFPTGGAMSAIRDAVRAGKAIKVALNRLLSEGRIMELPGRGRAEHYFKPIILGIGSDGQSGASD